MWNDIRLERIHRFSAQIVSVWHSRTQIRVAKKICVNRQTGRQAGRHILTQARTRQKYPGSRGSASPYCPRFIMIRVPSARGRRGVAAVSHQVSGRSALTMAVILEQKRQNVTYYIVRAGNLCRTKLHLIRNVRVSFCDSLRSQHHPGVSRNRAASRDGGAAGCCMGCL